jgi:MFS transporter, AAHS family, 4-hydroxybenzoate transporter
MDSQRIGPWQLVVVLVALLALVVDGLDIQLLALVAPVILQEWNVDRAAFGPAMSAALIGMSLGASAGGLLGDRYGRKPITVVSILLFGMATIAAAYTVSVAQMTTLRIVGGIGFGAVAPNAISLVTEWLPLRVRPRVVGLLSIGTPLGGLIGAATLTSVLPSLGWKGCFILCGALSLILAVIVLITLPESPAYLIAKGKENKAAELMRRYVGVELKAAEATGIGVESLRSADTESVFSRANRRVNIGVWIGAFGIAFVSFAFAAWSPVFLTMAGFTLPQALQSSLSFNLCAVVAAIGSGFLITQIGSRLLVGFSCIATLGCVSAIALALNNRGGEVDASTRTLVMLASGGAGAFLGAATASMYSILAAVYPASCRSGGIGFGMTMGRAGAIASTLSGGALLSIDGTNTAPFFSALALCIMLGVCGVLIIDRHIVADRSAVAVP